LKPKNHKYFYEDVAKEVGVHKEVVDNLIAFYYAKIRKSLSELKDTHISIASLGTFTLRKSRLEKTIKRNKDILGNLEKMTYKGYEKYIPVKNKIKIMEEALEKLNKKLKAKKDFKNENK
jgi:nucleoid DNA-binding protein